MRILRSIAGILAAVMFMLSAVSGLSFADDVVITDDDVVITDREIDPETGLEFKLLDDGTYEISYPVENSEELTGELVIPAEYNGKSVTSIAIQAFFNCDGLTSVTIPQGITNIGGEAFFDCGGLTSITIPQSVTSIGVCAFTTCARITSINVDENNEYYCSDDGVLFNKNKTELVSYPPAKKIETYVVPESVTKIGDFAFLWHGELVSIDLHDGITTIGRFSFELCKNLTSLMIPSSVTKIDEAAFYGCESLTSIVVPDGIVSIERRTFDGCSGLKSVTIPTSVMKIGEIAFRDTSIKDVYYEGSESQWSKIEIEADNDILKNATMHYATTEPDVPNPDDIDKPNTSDPTTSKPVASNPTESDTSSSTTSKPDDTSSDTSGDTSEPTIDDTSNPTTSEPIENESVTSEPPSDDTSGTNKPIVPDKPNGDSGEVSKNVQLGGNAPKTEIVTPKGTLMEAVLTDEEREQLENGTDMDVSLMVNVADSSVSDTDKSIAEEAMRKAGYKLGLYLDLKLFKTIGGKEMQINKTNEPITISFEIPEALRGENREYAVVRVHNGKADILDVNDDIENTLMFRTDKFSTYVLAYSEKSGGISITQPEDNSGNVPGSTGRNPNTGGNSHAKFFFLAGIASLFVFIILCLFTGKNGMTEEEKEQKFSKLISWGKRGGKVRAAIALIVIFLLLSFYYGIGMKKSAK